VDPSLELQRMRANERPFTAEFLLQGAEEPLPLSDESMDTVVMTWACASRAPLNHRNYQRRSEVTAMSVCLVNTGSTLFAFLHCVVDAFPSGSVQEAAVEQLYDTRPSFETKNNIASKKILTRQPYRTSLRWSRISSSPI
jgi:hypothetical protein